MPSMVCLLVHCSIRLVHSKGILSMARHKGEHRTTTGTLSMSQDVKEHALLAAYGRHPGGVNPRREEFAAPSPSRCTVPTTPSPMTSTVPNSGNLRADSPAFCRVTCFFNLVLSQIFSQWRWCRGCLYRGCRHTLFGEPMSATPACTGVTSTATPDATVVMHCGAPVGIDEAFACTNCLPLRHGPVGEQRLNAR